MLQKTQMSVTDAPPKSKPPIAKPMKSPIAKPRTRKDSKPRKSLVKTAVRQRSVEGDGFQVQEEEEESPTLKSVKSIVNERTSDVYNV
ncbi:hypothetical protein Y032_0363g3524 [Ancylostoma ceylanicum]|uniref:Uncharacterized protein n=1 Tax=Ancylostoma ceylanicum TaxID=53326 RepID=A0A016RVW9_9BILA|nr:hypothetical protein Y032_0363g3524 [Ancylostoma ceylanicum]